MGGGCSIFGAMSPISTTRISQLICVFNDIHAIFADIRYLVSYTITIICLLFKLGYDVGLVWSVISVPETQMS